jgi:hypothetical protein
MTDSVDGRLSLCACNKIRASSLSSDIEARIAVIVRSTFEKMRTVTDLYHQ